MSLQGGYSNLKLRCGVQFEIPRYLKGQGEGCCGVVLIDRRGEDARLDIRRHGVHVVRRRQPPALLPRVEKTVIAQVIVRVGNQNIEHQPPPQRPHVAFRRGPVLAQRVDNFQIASGFAVLRSEHAHRGEEGNAPLALPVKAAEQEDAAYSAHSENPCSA